MSLPADYHMHTPLCRHARGEPEEYVKSALALGFKEIGFSDHAPMPKDDFDNWRMNADSLDEYVAKSRNFLVRLSAVIALRLRSKLAEFKH